MAPSPSTSPAEYAALLLAIARRSIEHGVLCDGRALQVDPARYPESLRAHVATFVTLSIGGTLRGCKGSLEPTRPLILDVAQNACATALTDPRFPAVAEHELPVLDIELSLLSAAEPLFAETERDVLAALEPGRHGLTLERDGHRATFLPKVWESLPEPHVFVGQLLHKGGFGDRWPAGLRAFRYTTWQCADFPQ